MAADTLVLCPDFPISVGNRKMAIGILTGPAQYAQVVQGSPPTGGQTLSASQFGMKYLEMVTCSLSDTGNFWAVWTPATDGKQPVTEGILEWLDANTWLEVAALGVLSAEVIRVQAWGR